MNHRFLSIAAFIVSLTFATGCGANKGAVGNENGHTALGKTSVQATENTAPAWAPKKHSFNPSRTLEHDLLHTKLRVSFEWEKQHVHGLAELTLKPYFYPQNTLTLDAKGMEIHSVNLMKGYDASPLTYKYDGEKLEIALNRTYARNEEYTLEIDYTAKPNERKSNGSDAITDDKGLYFINPLGKEPNKPMQIWTQGETEASSAWFPTIDTPNERMTQEIYITVNPKFTTLSNGTFMYSRQNADGTKTDYWKQELPHAPYLAMMAIGEFAVVKDTWRNMEVNYYVEPAFKSTAKQVFGNTPEMLEFFSKKLGVEYPWSKYAQVVVRDFVSGAMENTSASTFMEDLQLNERELLDKNWDGIIAHELFHQWFGDYVTTESWANLPLNEAFANYSEYLWAEHKHGADEAAYLQIDELEQYLQEAEEKREPLIRYYYGDKEDMFDNHSYAKGGRVLHMLRKQVGDEAWWASLNHYLQKHKYTAVEVAELRMAFEDVTGQDLMWFFDQWFMKPGHPELKVAHNFENGQLQLKVEQVQDTTYMPVYRLPLDVAIWVNGKKTVHPIVIDKASQIFSFSVAGQPELVLFDAKQQLLGTIEHPKSKQEYVYQFYNSQELGAKLEAIEALSSDADAEVVKLLEKALQDNYWVVRSAAINSLREVETAKLQGAITDVVRMSRQDKKSTVRADAIMALANWGGNKYKNIFEQAIQDSSYQVASAALLAYASTGAPDALQKFSQFDDETNEDIVITLATYYALKGGASKNNWFLKQVQDARGGAKYYVLQSFGAYLAAHPETNTPETIEMLADIARNHPIYYVRGAAYQTLMVMSEKEEVRELMRQIKENEGDTRLKEMY